MDDFGEQNRKITIFNWRTRKMKERNVVLMLMLMCAVLSSPLLAGVTPGPNGGRDFVEFLVPGSIYLDFVDSSNSMNNTYTNGDLTLVTSGAGADNWNWPDTSDDEDMVNGDFETDGGNDGDSYDIKENTASDFIATISGLEPLAGYQVYVKAFRAGPTDYGYAWGVSSASENVITETTEDDGIWVDIGRDGGGGSEGPRKACYLYLLREESFTATSGGEIVLHFGQGGNRTQFDGVLLKLIDPTFNPAPVVNAGPDQILYYPEGLPVQLDGTMSDLGPTDPDAEGYPGGIASFYWAQESGPGTATFLPNATTEDPTVTFDMPGTYELFLEATDGFKDANDVVVIDARDHADDILIGHWEMEDNLLDTSVNSNHGTHYENEHPMPPATFVAGAIGTSALLLVNPDNNDPNVEYVYLGDAPELDIQTVPPEFTVSAWFKTTNGNDQVIVGKGGDDGGGIRWMLMVDSRGTRFLTDNDDDKEDPRGPQDDNDDVWHHAVGVSDSWGLRVYVDGVQTGQDERGSSDYDISGSSQRPGLIGAGTSVNHTEPNGVNNKMFDGLIDDVRLYNYALPLYDATYLDILELAAMGELRADVDAGPNASYELQPNESIPTDVTVVDNGIPGPLNYQWETVSKPADSNAVFADDTALNTTITFPDFGVYVLRVSVFDVNVGEITDSSTVTMTIISPTCDDVINATPESLRMVGDISGPDGTPDCRVDLYDIAKFVADFGRCNDPQEDCEDAWGG